MSDHSHSDCEHKRLAYCRQHDVTWCRLCEREWGTQPYYWWSTQSPTTTVTYPATTTTVDLPIPMTSHADHGGSA